MLQMECNKKTLLKRQGDRTNPITSKLLDKIRDRLGVTKDQLSDKQIKETIYLTNKEIGKWILDNTEGLHLHKDKGVLAVSKYLPPELREGKYEKLEDILNSNMPDHKKAIIAKRFDTNAFKRANFPEMKEGKFAPLLNSQTFFYSYKIMWFNHRNCDFKKASVYEFSATGELKQALHDKIMEGKDYYEWNFSDFYYFKIKPQ